MQFTEAGRVLRTLMRTWGEANSLIQDLFTNISRGQDTQSFCIVPAYNQSIWVVTKTLIR